MSVVVSQPSLSISFQSKEGGDTDDEQEQERLDEIEMFLSQHDLTFIKFVIFINHLHYY